jgi:hypothetical protein
MGNASGHWNGQRFFFGEDSKSTRNKSKIRQIRLYQIKKFWIAKEIINRWKENGRMEEIQNGKKIANYTSDKGVNIQNI